MSALFIALMAVPFLASRALLGVLILGGFYVVQGFFRSGRPLEAILIGIVWAGLTIAFEWIKAKVSEGLRFMTEGANELWRLINLWFGPAVCMLWAAGQLTETGRALMRDVQFAAFGEATPASLGIIVAGVLAFAVVWLRQRLVSLLDEVPLLGELGVGALGGIFERAWVVIGLLALFILPVLSVVLGLGAVTVWVIAVVQLRRLAAGARSRCDSCGTSVHLAAPHCHGCGAIGPSHSMTAFGRPTNSPMTDASTHALSLVDARRCPWCAERLSHSKGLVVCAVCDRRPFNELVSAKTVAGRADRRLLALMPVFAGIAAVPLLGLGGALLAYRISPASTVTGLVPLHHRLVTRIGRAIALTGLALLQPIPLVGIVAALGIIAAQHAWARRAFLAAS